jgi:Family of unknown function (DUF6166)
LLNQNHRFQELPIMRTEIYTGTRTNTGCVVMVTTVNGDREETRELPLRLDLINRSPTGFEWGYSGSGPAHLALAILAWHCCNDENRALRPYQQFKAEVIVTICADNWRMTSEYIENQLRQIERSLQPETEGAAL